MIKRKDYVMKKTISIIGAAAGALSVCFSFYILSLDTGSWVGSVQYGGDAYTGIQNAAATTANNLTDLASIMRFGFFAVLLIAGAALLCQHAPVLLEEMKSAETQKKAVSTAAAPDQANVEANVEAAVEAASEPAAEPDSQIVEFTEELTAVEVEQPDIL